MFKDRKEAGKFLAKSLEKHRNDKIVILALPRGGVVVGYEIAKALKAPFDVLVTRKIGHPDNSEYAICAVDEKGSLLCNEMATKLVDPKWLNEEILHQQKEAKRRVALYQGKHIPEKIKGKIAIIVDDGIATGLSMMAAVRSVKMQNPQKIIVAIPVAPLESINLIYDEGADEVVTLEPSARFMGSVGAHYIQFEQVEDSEVINLLQKSHERRSKDTSK